MTRRASATLTYHLVAGKVLSTDMTEGMMAKTVNGADVAIALDGGAKVSGAVISTADIKASNGVVHVIDAVILPPMSSGIFVRPKSASVKAGFFFAAQQPALGINRACRLQAAGHPVMSSRFSVHKLGRAEPSRLYSRSDLKSTFSTRQQAWPFPQFSHH